ncbi:MAG: response regulator [Anaerolineales bacterium]|nr:response regulator [Anaerolineales bacterium]
MNLVIRTKVLIAEENPQVAKELEKLLNLIDNVDLVNKVGSAQEALDSIAENKPDVALVDLSLPDMDGINLIDSLRKINTITQVIIVSDDKDYNTMLRAIRRGASDFISHDVTFEELNIAVKRASDLAFAEKVKSDPTAFGDDTTQETGEGEGDEGLGKIVTIYSPKGGTGVTSIAINLAISLLDKEATVAVVDSSMQFGDVPIFLNEIARYSIIDLIPRVNDLDNKILEDVLVFHKTSGLHLLNAPPRPELAEKVNGNHLSQILEQMRQMFSYIVVNTSSYISDHCLAALDAGDVIVVVTTQEIIAIRAARAFMELWDGLNMSKERLLLTLNRYDKGKNISPERVSEILKHKVAGTIPLDEERALRAANYGIPFMTADKNALISQSVTSLAELVRRQLAEVAEEERFRLFSAVG